MVLWYEIRVSRRSSDALTLATQRKDRIVVEARSIPEDWREIAHAPNYAVSNWGRVKRTAPGHGTYVGRILALADTQGYKQVNLAADGRVRSHRVHVLVAEAFLGQRPSALHQVAHADGRRDNNFVGNLRWATPVENAADDLANGVRPMGASHPCARLTDDDVTAIRQAYAEMIDTVSRTYGLSAAHVRSIISGKAWATRRQFQPPATSALR
jgi:hypothetical protein